MFCVACTALGFAIFFFYLDAKVTKCVVEGYERVLKEFRNRINQSILHFCLIYPKEIRGTYECYYGRASSSITEVHYTSAEKRKEYELDRISSVWSEDL